MLETNRDSVEKNARPYGEAIMAAASNFDEQTGIVNRKGCSKLGEGKDQEHERSKTKRARAA